MTCCSDTRAIRPQGALHKQYIIESIIMVITAKRDYKGCVSTSPVRRAMFLLILILNKRFKNKNSAP